MRRMAGVEKSANQYNPKTVIMHHTVPLFYALMVAHSSVFCKDLLFVLVSVAFESKLIELNFLSADFCKQVHWYFPLVLDLLVENCC